MHIHTTSSPYVKLKSVGPGHVRWTGGFWADRFKVCHEAMIPNMWRLLRDPDLSHAYANFLIAAGLQEGEHHGPPWHDGDFFKWMEAAALVYGVTRDEALDRLLDEIVEVIRKAQREDGYIHTPVIIEQRRAGSPAQEFRDRLDFETYNMGHLMTAACVHRRATGKTTLLDIARKAADYLYAFCQALPAELAQNAICPSHYMGVVELYRTTGDPRYLDLARTLIDIRDLVRDGTDHNQDRIPFREQTRAVGHAVRANYLYAGLADVYAETGDKSLLTALARIWENVALHKMYITGATGALYDGASPDGSSDRREIQLVHQAYGREYQLPNITAYNETCATVGNALWNWRMLAITGEARFADVLELALYNGILETISLDGTRFFYRNALRQVDELPFHLRWSERREPYIECFCCPPNVVRTIAGVGNCAYSVSGQAVWVTLYGSSVLDTELPDGARLALRQETDYPWDGAVRITVERAVAEDMAVMLRIPGWADSAALRVNGRAVACEPRPGEYLQVSRRWSVGDVIELDLPMRTRLMEAHPLVEEARNRVAVQRGPLVYCLESHDLPAGVGVSDVVVSRKARWTPVAGERSLRDLLLLRGQALAVERRDWSHSLYREISDRPPREIDLTLIPYYAWGNRGPSEMTVWLPVTR